MILHQLQKVCKYNNHLFNQERDRQRREVKQQAERVCIFAKTTQFKQHVVFVPFVHIEHVSYSLSGLKQLIECAYY